jgi:hypothetical protein
VKKPSLSTMARAVARVGGAIMLSACTQRATATLAPEPGTGDETPLTCIHSDTGMHRTTIMPASRTSPGTVSGILRGTDHELIRNASVVTLQQIGGGATLRARADSSGRFAIANVPAGKFELRVVSIGYLTSRDTLSIPQDGMSVDVTQVIMRFLDEQVMCGYLASIDSEPVLALARAQTTTATHALPSGGSVQTTLTVRPRADGASFDVMFRNAGATPVNITRLCYPTITGDPVRRVPGAVGPACYGTGMKLAAGDSIAIRESVQLRGRPGTYTIRVHAVDPPVLDAVVPLTLARGRSPRGKAER